MTPERLSAVARGLALAMTVGMVAAVSTVGPCRSRGQDQTPDPVKHQQHQGQATVTPVEASDTFAAEIERLRDQVARIEAALFQGYGSGRSQPMGRQAMRTGSNVGGRVPAGYRISAQYADCLRCHQTMPTGPLPLSHLESTGDAVADKGMAGNVPAGNAPVRSASPAEQLQQLREQVARLEATLAQGRTAGTSSPMSRSQGMGQGAMGGMGMDMMGGGMGMGMMGGGQSGAKAGMGMMDDDMDMGMLGMSAMGQGPGMGGMSMGSSLPGFPGISHLYHIGADGFFLNHVGHITLSPEQRKKLNHIKEKAVLDGSTCTRKVEEAEQDLWELTAADEPDASAIEVKVREIEKLRADSRLTFIRAIGEAAQVLTDDQRRALAGTATDASSSGAHAKH